MNMKYGDWKQEQSPCYRCGKSVPMLIDPGDTAPAHVTCESCTNELRTRDSIPDCMSCEDNPATEGDKFCTKPEHGHDCTCDACVWCTCDACMDARERIDPALLAHVAYVLRDVPTPAPEPDLIPHCPVCLDTPAADNDPDGLCVECRLAAEYDAQPVCQENEERPFRTGSRPVLSPFARSLNIAREMGFSVRENVAHRRYALLPLAGLLALSLGSTSAADYTPTAPIGCTITRYFAQDDMSAIAVCAGSYTIHKEAGPIDEWDIPFAVSTTYLTDDAGTVWAWPVLD